MPATEWIASLAQDIRYAARSLRASPIVTLIVVATLAIGVGATTAIFSTVNAMLLRPLPYPRAGELVSVRTRYVDGRATTGLALRRRDGGAAQPARRRRAGGRLPVRPFT